MPFVVTQVIHNPPNAVSQDFDIEVNEEPYCAPGQFQVGEHLCTVDGSDLLDALDFDHNLAIDEQVNPKRAIDLELLPHQRNRLPDLHLVSGFDEHVREAQVVNGLEEAWTVAFVNSDGAANDGNR